MIPVGLKLSFKLRWELAVCYRHVNSIVRLKMKPLKHHYWRKDWYKSLEGDGAQGNLTLEKLNDSNLYKFTYDDPGDKGNWVYLLKRRDHIGYGYNGWHIESKQYNKK